MKLESIYWVIVVLVLVVVAGLVWFSPRVDVPDEVEPSGSGIELSTEKSVVVIPSPVDGEVKKICVKEADTIDPDTLLMVIE